MVAAAQAAAARDGVGAGGSRLVTGTRPVHMELEAELAAWLGRDRALLFPSGFQANLAAVLALADRHSLVIADRLIHHSLLTGVAASGARLRRFAHNDLAQLERRLSEARRSKPEQRLLVLSESLFSMQGTSPDVPALAALCERFGAALLLDEAHALGVLGPGGRGTGPRHRLDRPDQRHLRQGLRQRRRLPGRRRAGDGVAAAEQRRLPLHHRPGAAPGRRGPGFPAADPAPPAEPLAAGQPPADLLDRARRWRDGLEAAGWPRPPGEGPILPLLVGSDERALALQQQLESAGLLAVAIRPPTVPEGTARLRLVLRADLPSGTLERLLVALGPP